MIVLLYSTNYLCFLITIFFCKRALAGTSDIFKMILDMVSFSATSAR